MSRAPTKHLDDLRLLPKEGPFKFRDYFTTPPSEEATEQPSIGPGDFVEIVGQPGIWYSFSSLHKISDEEVLIMLGWVGKA